MPSAERPGQAIAAAKLADVVGLDLVTFQDHPYQARFLDTWTLLSYLAAETETVRLAPNVANLPLRNPAVLARSVASLDIYKEEGLFERARDLSGYWEDGVHSLKGLPNVIDLRNLGLIAGIELAPRPGKPTARAFEAFLSCYEKGVLIRTTGDIIALSPPLIVETGHIDQIFGTISEVLKTLN